MGELTPAAVCDALVDSGVDLAASLPDTWLVALIEALAADERITHIPVTREESAIAVCAGAFCGGRTGVAVIGTSGFMACVYAINKICTSYEIGVPILTDLRGDIGEKATHHYGNALYARPVLAALGIPLVRIETAEDLDRIESLITHARLIKRPVMICLPKPDGREPNRFR